MRERLRRCLGWTVSVLRAGTGILAAVWGLAAFLLLCARSRMLDATEVRYALGAALAFVSFLVIARWLPRPRFPWLSRAIGLLLVLGFLSWYGESVSDRALLTRLPGTDLFVPNGLGVSARQTNEFLMRGAPGRDRPEGVPTIALVGCSMILGAGVEDPDAPDAWLERQLRDTRNLETRVFNFGLAAGGAGALGELVGYASRELSPDLVVVYLPAHHMTPGVDHGFRQALLGGNPIYRLLVASHFEPLYVLAATVLGAPGKGADAAFEEKLLAIFDDFVEKAGGSALMIVSDMRDGSHYPQLRTIRGPHQHSLAIARWAGRHPGVRVVDVSDDPAWQAAGTQPDSHWTVEGIRTVTGILSGWVEKTLRERSLEGAS